MLHHEVPWEHKIDEITEKRVLYLCDINPEDDNSQITLLDYGCGTGRYLEVFARHLAKNNLFGTEITGDLVDEVRGKEFNCIHLNGPEDKLPFKNEFFNIVFSSNVMEHIPKEHYFNYLLEIHRVLKEGGRFVLGTPNYPIKRFYDVLKAFKTGMYKYYLFDDRSHCNKLSIHILENDLIKYFDEVHLEPSYILFESRFKLLEDPKIRAKLRSFGDKVVGYCLKKSKH